jgi:hypothetical protein
MTRESLPPAAERERLAEVLRRSSELGSGEVPHVYFSNVVPLRKTTNKPVRVK